METPLCSILVVNFNGRQHLEECLRSFESLDYPGDRIEILLIDNGSEDGAELDAAAAHGRLRLLRSPSNNFAAALNMGVAESSGSYVAFANNDVFVEPNWLAELVGTLESNPRAGCAGGKILFTNGRINSVGHRALPDFYWEDEGYNLEDRGQFDHPGERDGLCWAAVLFRRACLADVGPIDEDFVLYYEDVDTSLRCRERGWKLLYNPAATARHVFHGSSQGGLADAFIDRARLIYVAKYHPDRLAEALGNSRLVAGGALEWLYDSLPAILRKLILGHTAEIVEESLNALQMILVRLYGSLAVDQLLARMQVILGHRRMSVAFYDQAMHILGGGQKYGCTMAAAIHDLFDVTLLANRHVTLADVERWYGLSLPDSKLKIIPLPFFEKRGEWIDSEVVAPDIPNPFEPVSLASRRFDVFVNVNMLTMVRPLSPFSVFLCHFPDTARRCYFAVDDYSCLFVNSLYTAQWVEALWGLQHDAVLYPPVDMAVPPIEKENLILSVARFEPGGSKKQHELVHAFELLWESHYEIMKDWRLVLAGGSMPRNRYLAEVERLVRRSPAPITIQSNLPLSDLQKLYARSKIFWHACGLGESAPRLIEHFGMSIVEAMQNRCLPIVFNGGGQREIVEQGRSGFRFDTLDDLCQYTGQVISSPELMEQLQAGAVERSRAFTRRRFEEFVRDFFQAVEDEYRKVQLPDPRDFLRNRREGNLFFSSAARRPWSRFPLPPRAG